MTAYSTIYSNIVEFEVFFILLIFITVNCQLSDTDYPQKPDRCQVPIEVMYRQCCIFPPFFTHDIARICGAQLTMNFVHGNVTGFTRRTVSRCNHWRCVLAKYDMLTVTQRVDDEKYFKHLDKWVELNPPFANVMANAKVNCKLNHRHLLPLDPCEFFNFHACIRNYINMDCPAYLDTPECIEVKEFNAECKEFFNKK